MLKSIAIYVMTRFGIINKLYRAFGIFCLYVSKILEGVMKNIGKKIISVICCLVLLICGGFSVCKAIPQIGSIFENKSLNFAGKLSGAKNELEQDCKENHPFINYFYYLYGKTISVLGQREVVDSELNVYKLKNGWLTHIQKDVSPE